VPLQKDGFGEAGGIGLFPAGLRLLIPEYLLEEFCGPRCRILTDFSLLLREHEEKPIKGPVGHVLIQIKTQASC
jgi:hypothetical protein